MITNLLLSLEVTGLGMGLVFGAIILLWVMMILLTAITRDREASDKETADVVTPESDSVSESGSKARAAALAVAIALAEQQQSTARPLQVPPTALVSAWQLGMRTSQRTQKGSIGRR